MKKELYEKLELEVIRFRTEDIITTSEQITDRETEDPTGRQQTPFITDTENNGTGTALG